jgi:hypothetical protein
MANVIINGIQAEIDNGLSNIVGYNFLKTVFSNHQTIQKKRAEEFLEFIKENEQKFTVELINNECFVSGLALTLREIIQQYSEIKRVKIYSIFLGFVESEDKENFELEKMYHTLNLMSLEDLHILNNYSGLGVFRLTQDEVVQETKDGIKVLFSRENMKNLASIGIVKEDIEFRDEKEARVGNLNSSTFSVLEDSLFKKGVIYVEIYEYTNFGKKFKKFAFSQNRLKI